MAGSYDRAITRFSPDGKLFQIDYAFEAVKKGSSVVCLRTADRVVLGVERKAVAKLQDPRTLRKILRVDQHLTLAFAGLSADARVLVAKARLECQSYRLTADEAPSLEYVARYIARTQQRFTQRGGVRPFGVSSILAGFKPDGSPALYQIDPSGTYFEWKANALGGRNFKSQREFLEKEWKDGLTEDAGTRLCIQTLLEVVDPGVKNLEICVLENAAPMRVVTEEVVQGHLDSIQAEKDATKAAAGDDEGASEMKD